MKKLLNDGMSQYSPLNQTTDFFNEVTAQTGKIQK